MLDVDAVFSPETIYIELYFNITIQRNGFIYEDVLKLGIIKPIFFSVYVCVCVRGLVGSRDGHSIKIS